jgi:RNA polymerase sigma factor for flagellar operon FliA
LTEKATTTAKKKKKTRPGRVSLKERDRLIEKYAPMIKHLALRIAMRLPSHIELEDLINSGVIGLMDAIEKFDPEKGVRFETYAEFRIRGAILDELRAQDWVSRSVRQKANQLSRAYAELEQKLGRSATDEEVMKELGLEREAFYKLVDRVRSISLINWDEITGREKLDGTTGEVPSDFWKGTDPFRDLNIRRVRQVLQNAIEVLPEKERIVVSLYYYADLNMKEIGEVLDITESRISQIHTKAVLRLRGKILNSFS